MVNHVENLHAALSSTIHPHALPTPVLAASTTSVHTQQPPPSPYYFHSQQSHVAAPVGRNVPHARADEQCPFCRFVSSDPVILVNHVEHMHS
ncbi:hypothetical protein PINS_up013063 [Pythium insidiosum]|nr:hypothetical protein PINS_up013063 [Pythium insidiosum]